MPLFLYGVEGLQQGIFYGSIPSRMKQCKMGNDGIPPLPIGGKEMKKLSSYFARFPIRMLNDHSFHGGHKIGEITVSYNHSNVGNGQKHVICRLR